MGDAVGLLVVSVVLGTPTQGVLPSSEVCTQGPECVVGLVGQMVEAELSFGYRTVANLLGLNKKTVQRNFQWRGQRVCKRLIGR